MSGQQLFFADMKRRTPGRKPTQTRTTPSADHSDTALRSGPPAQLRLCDAPRDFRRFDAARHADPDNPWLLAALDVSRRMGEKRGWKPRARWSIAQGLTIVLSGYQGDEGVSYLAMVPALRAHTISVERVAEVLATMDILVDDRPRPFDLWLDRRLDGLSPGIRGDVEGWLRTLRDGGPRTPARHPQLVYVDYGRVESVLRSWSRCHEHLREITRVDVIAALDGRTGRSRSSLLVALRSLFRWCLTRKTIFRDPAARMRAPGVVQVLQPIRRDDLADALRRVTTPAGKLLVTLAAVYAARPAATRGLQLTDVDLGNRLITISGRRHHLDELSLEAVTRWLQHRRASWPGTANPHLLINRRSATKHSPVAHSWIGETLRGQVVTLQRLCQDRWLEEAIACGADPVHLVAVFGIDPKTAMHYAASARELLQVPLESNSNHAGPNSRQID